MRSFLTFSVLGFLAASCLYFSIDRIEHPKGGWLSDTFLFAATLVSLSIFSFSTYSIIKPCCFQEPVFPEMIGDLDQMEV